MAIIKNKNGTLEEDVYALRRRQDQSASRILLGNFKMMILFRGAYIL